MKHLKIANILSIVVLIFLITNGAYAYTFNDSANTNVEWYYKLSPNVNDQGNVLWSDVVGSRSVFDTFGANLSGNTFTIFTNWNPGKDGADPTNTFAGVKTADLFINSNGTLYAIRLDTTTGQGKVFANPSFATSQDLLAGSGLFYGGVYNEASPTLVPVLALGTSSVFTSVVWTYGSDNQPSQVAMDLSGLNLGNTWSFLWGTGICGNDTFAGNVSVVPEPGILLLLGVGLIGLGGLRKKFKE